MITVSELTRAITVALQEKIGAVAVQGEISNFKAHSSGHRYFTLKDSGAQVSCVMWRSRSLSFRPVDGMKVVVRGRLSVYPPRGSYQIDCTSMTPLGEGDLYMAFEALKKKLSEKGYFEYDIKKPIPGLPLNIGVTTSPTGAAVRDIFSTIERRFPAATIYFRPSIVQGDGAGPDIAKAIKELHDTPAQVLIVGRGGGSIEDLWGYNTEEVADAIYNSEIPIISAVGHETDFTIADFTADFRAATPTAAAEIVTPRTTVDLLDILENWEDDMLESMKSQIENMRHNIENLDLSYAFGSFPDILKSKTQRVDELDASLLREFSRRIKYDTQKVESLDARLTSLHPESPLKKGFALLKSGNKYLSAADSLAGIKDISIIRTAEEALAEIKEVKKINNK